MPFGTNESECVRGLIDKPDRVSYHAEYQN
jgi:hypothetical protein